MDLPIYRTSDGHDFPGFETPDGQIRLLACLPSPAGLKARMTSWSQSGNPTIPQSDWREFDNDRPEVPILDQGQTGSCVGHGSITAFMFDRASQGMEFVYLSACWLYGLINGGRDQGANIGDAMVELKNTGAALLSEVPEGMIYSRSFPPSAKQTALRFKIEDAYTISSWAEKCSAVQLGYAVSDSIYVGGDFNNLDANGCPPARRGPGNHCIFAGSGMKKLSSGEWIVKGRNSWGERWGQNGRLATREAHIENQGQYDGFAIKAAIADPSDPTNIPHVA